MQFKREEQPSRLLAARGLPQCAIIVFTTSRRVRWDFAGAGVLPIWPPLSFPKNSIRADSRVEAESEHHPGRCLHAFGCLGWLSPTSSGRDASLKFENLFLRHQLMAYRDPTAWLGM
jgi:hypothetical protein